MGVVELKICFTHTHSQTQDTHTQNKLIRLDGFRELATESHLLFLRAHNEI